MNNHKNNKSVLTDTDASKPARKAEIAMTAEKPVAATTRKRAPNYTDEEKRAALELVIACGGNVAEAARRAGIDYESLKKWAAGDHVNAEIYNDYTENARARVRKRLDAMHASADEVLSLLAEHLRADIADLTNCFQENGALDLKAAQKIERSRLLKKLKHRRTPVRDSDGSIVDYEYTTEIELHDSQAAAAKLMQIHGLAKQAAENPADAETRRAFWREQIADVMAQMNLNESDAKIWLLQNVPSAQSAQQWIM